MSPRKQPAEGDKLAELERRIAIIEHRLGLRYLHPDTPDDDGDNKGGEA